MDLNFAKEINDMISRARGMERIVNWMRSLPALRSVAVLIRIAQMATDGMPNEYHDTFWGELDRETAHRLLQFEDAKWAAEMSKLDKLEKLVKARRDLVRVQHTMGSVRATDLNWVLDEIDKLKKKEV